MTEDEDARQAIATELNVALEDAAATARAAAIMLRRALAIMAPDIDTYRMGTVKIVADQAAAMAQATEVILDAARRANREFTLELMVEPPELDETGL